MSAWQRKSVDIVHENTNLGLLPLTNKNKSLIVIDWRKEACVWTLWKMHQDETLLMFSVQDVKTNKCLFMRTSRRRGRTLLALKKADPPCTILKPFDRRLFKLTSDINKQNYLLQHVKSKKFVMLDDGRKLPKLTKHQRKAHEWKIECVDSNKRPNSCHSSK